MITYRYLDSGVTGDLGTVIKTLISYLRILANLFDMTSQLGISGSLDKIIPFTVIYFNIVALFWKIIMWLLTVNNK